MKEFEDALLGAAGRRERANSTPTFSADHANKKLAGKTATLHREDREGGRADCPPRSTRNSRRASASPTAASTACAAKCARTWSASCEAPCARSCAPRCSKRLYTKNPLELPRRWSTSRSRSCRWRCCVAPACSDAKQLPPREPFEEPARRRVTLGLLMGELVRRANLKVESRIRAGKVERTRSFVFQSGRSATRLLAERGHDASDRNRRCSRTRPSTGCWPGPGDRQAGDASPSSRSSAQNEQQ